MPRRIPPVLGLITAIVALWLAPTATALLMETARLDELGPKMLGLGLALVVLLQLITGLVIAFEGPVARGWLAMWSLMVSVVLAAVLLTVDRLPGMVVIASVVQVLAPLVILWVSPLVARLHEASSRRVDLAAILTALAAMTLIGTVLDVIERVRLFGLTNFLGVDGAIQVAWLLPAVGVAVLALWAARCLRDGAARRARRALLVYVSVKMAVRLISDGIALGSLLLDDENRYLPVRFYLHFVTNAVFVSTLAMVLGAYARRELRADAADEPPVVSPHVYAGGAAWGLLWLAPTAFASSVGPLMMDFLRAFELSALERAAHAGLCVLTALAYVTTAIATLRGHAMARRFAMFAVAGAVAITVLTFVLWLGADGFPSRVPGDLSGLQHHLALAGTVWWLLRPRVRIATARATLR